MFPKRILPPLLLLDVQEVLVGVHGQLAAGRLVAGDDAAVVVLQGGAGPLLAHAPLLTDGGGKLSKRLGSRSTQLLRQELRPEELVGRLAFLCGLLPEEEPLSARELLAVFDWEKVRREDILLSL